MKRTIQSVTCDNCNKEMDWEPDAIQVYVEWKYRVKKGDFCSYACALKWFDMAVQEVLGWCDSISNEDVDNLTTDQWGGAGPDCCTVPV